MGQPGGWGYSVLPYIEEQQLHDLGKGLSPEQQLDTNAQLHGTPVGIYHCPSRREARPYPVVVNVDFVKKPRVSGPVSIGARNDYAANGGERLAVGFGEGPKTLAVAEHYVWSETKEATGIIANGKEFGIQSIVDGTSKVYMIGEKYVSPDEYATGTSLGDDQSVYSGDERDVVRFTAGLVPFQDRPGILDTWNFGSAHSEGFNMALCDGSVRMVSYSIDPTMHRRFSNRRDQEVVEFP